MSLLFEFEWTDPGEARGDDLRATWAQLRIRVGDAIITHALDQATKAEREWIYLPLLPLAEWVAANWFFLLHEAGSRHTRTGSYLARHSIAASGEGYVLPNLCFYPEGDQIELRWQGYRSRYAAVSFLAAGYAHLEIEDVRDSLFKLVQAVVERLSSAGFDNHSLIGEWESLQATDGEERQFAHAAASIGLDPFIMSSAQEDMLLLAYDRLPVEVFEEFLAITRYDDVATQVAWVTTAIDALATEAHGLNGLRDVKLSKRLRRFVEPHETGREWARLLRSELGIDGNAIRGLKGVVDLFGSYDELNDAGVFIEPEPRQQVLAVMEASDAPKFLLTRSRPDSQRFALSRGIFDYLASGRRVDLVADSYLAKDKASRSFAAEFLAPVSGLRRSIGTATVINDEVVLDLAEEFEVSTRVIEHQIRNHHIAELIPVS